MTHAIKTLAAKGPGRLGRQLRLLFCVPFPVSEIFHDLFSSLVVYTGPSFHEARETPSLTLAFLERRMGNKNAAVFGLVCHLFYRSVVD